MSYSIDWLASGVVVHFTGKITIEAINACDLAIYAHEHYPAIDYAVYNFQHADLSLLQLSGLKRTGREDLKMSHAHKPLKFAIVAKSSESKTLLAVYKNFCDVIQISWQIEIFSDGDSALEWAQS